MTTIQKRYFGQADGQDVDVYTMSNGDMEVEVLSYGATLRAIRMKDAQGIERDILLGYDTLEEYQNNGGYFGAVIGRNSNRIAGASFRMGGWTYPLTANDGTNNLHSGPDGFNCKVWEMRISACPCCGQKLVCTLHSPDMESGFPGNAEITVTYMLSPKNELSLEYWAKADADTVMNLTNHAYYNLGGHDSGSVEDHKVKIYSGFYTPVGEDLCPDGRILPVADTPYDFNQWKRIGEDIDRIPDLAVTGGYDHNFLLNTREGRLTLAAEAKCDQTGIRMKVYTTKPAMQFYAGNMIEPVRGKGGCTYEKRNGFCFETQVTPNNLSYPHLGNTVLKKGEEYADRTVIRFSNKAGGISFF